MHVRKIVQLHVLMDAGRPAKADAEQIVNLVAVQIVELVVDLLATKQNGEREMTNAVLRRMRISM